MIIQITIIALMCLFFLFIGKTLKERVEMFFCFLILGLVFLGVLWFPSAMLGTIPEKVAVVTNEVNLAALQDRSGIEGSMFLLIGHVSNEEYYHYIAQMDGFKEKGKIKSQGVRIKEDGENKIQYCKYKFKNKIWNLFLVPAEHCQTTIHLPEGSITEEFNIDLEE